MSSSRTDPDGSRYGHVAPLVAATALLVAMLDGCSLIVSVDGYADGFDSAAGRFSVTGSIDGLEGETVALSLNGVHTTTSGDGSFRFSNTLVDDTEYVLAVIANPPGHACSIDGATGRVTGRDIGDVRVHCPSTDATLTSITVSGATLSPPFASTTFAYGAGPLSIPTIFATNSTVLTAVSAHTGSRISLAGNPVTSGVPTSLALNAGVNAIDVDVTAADGKAKATYSVAVTARTSTYLKASNTKPSSFFGAPIAISGDTLAVGAPLESGGATASGGVYVFRRTPVGWHEEAYVKASNARAMAYFGGAVALQGDTLVVGSYGESSNASGVDGDSSDTSAIEAGAVYVFVRSGGAWSEKAYLKASNTRAGAHFGDSVAIDNDTIAVGAPLESSSARGVGANQSDSSAPGAGAVYVFSRGTTTWSQNAYVKASNARANASFGRSVALHANRLAVGSDGESSNAIGVGGNETSTASPNAGAAYVFLRSGPTWSQEAYVKASNTRPSAFFGSAVALTTDALIVGAPGESSNAKGVDGDRSNASASEAGAAYLFARGGAGWVESAYIKASNTRPGAKFGASVAIAPKMLVVGSPNESSNAIGVGGDPDDTSALGSGAAYVFIQDGTVWQQHAYAKASNTRPGAGFANSLGLSEDTLVVGSSTEASQSMGVDGNELDTSASQAGAAYVFR